MSEQIQRLEEWFIAGEPDLKRRYHISRIATAKGDKWKVSTHEGGSSIGVGSTSDLKAAVDKIMDYWRLRG